MTHFLFAQWDGGGSLPPELTVVRRLVGAGHHVTVLGDPVTEEEVRAVGVQDFRVWVTPPHHDTRRPEDDYIRDWELRSPLAILDNLVQTLMVRPAPLFAAETLAAIDDGHPDVLVSSFPLFGAQMAAEVRGIPQAVLVPNPLTLPVRGMPPPGMLPARGPLGRVRDRVAHAAVERLWNRRLPGLNQARASLGLDPLDRLLGQFDRVERVLALTSSAFDFPADLPVNVRYVGPQLDDPVWAEPWTPPPAAAGRPLVLVAMSTTFMDHVDQLQRAVDAVGSLPVRAVVTTGPAVDPEQIRAPDGVRVVRSAPHSQVLAHADVLLTHGGHGTVIRGLVAGVPIVCMPTGRDQPDNAARVRHRGAGVQISKKASPARVAAAVRRVLDDPAYRRAAVRLGRQLRKEADSDLVVRELEALSRRRAG